MRDFALFLEKNMGNMGHFQPISPYFFQIFTPCDVVSKKKEKKGSPKFQVNPIIVPVGFQPPPGFAPF